MTWSKYPIRQGQNGSYKSHTFWDWFQDREFVGQESKWSLNSRDTTWWCAWGRIEHSSEFNSEKAPGRETVPLPPRGGPESQVVPVAQNYYPFLPLSVSRVHFVLSRDKLPRSYQVEVLLACFNHSAEEQRRRTEKNVARRFVPFDRIDRQEGRSLR